MISHDPALEPGDDSRAARVMAKHFLRGILTVDNIGLALIAALTLAIADLMSLATVGTSP